MHIPKDILDIYKAFKKRGKKLYVVGGAVRDFVLGKEPKDYDLATDALPDETIDIAKENGFHVVEVGKSFGVVIVNDNEIATFRSDVGSGRRPDSVEFTTIDNDVKRRDLTINALFYDIDKKKIIDLVGGVNDLKNKIIRTVGNPDERFDEDKLRKLRALRFTTAMGGKLDPKTYDALKEDPSLDGISFERIKDEFLKSLEKTKSIVDYLDLLNELNFMDKIFPNLNVSDDYPEERNKFILIGYLLKDNDPRKIDKTLKDLKYNTEEARKIRFFIWLNHFNIDDLLLLKSAQKIANVTDDEILKFGGYIGENFKRFVNFKPSVTINDVPKELKGEEIKKYILNKEKEKFLALNELKKVLKKLLI